MLDHQTARPRKVEDPEKEETPKRGAGKMVDPEKKKRRTGATCKMRNPQIDRSAGFLSSILQIWSGRKPAGTMLLNLPLNLLLDHRLRLRHAMRVLIHLPAQTVLFLI